VAHPDWKHADSNILSCTPIPRNQLTLDASYSEQHPQDKDHSSSSSSSCCNSNYYYEVEVELITGRTHQLRAQFAALQAPIVGDSMYQPLSGYLLDDLDDPRIHALYPVCLEPQGRHGIALQCYKLRFLHYHVSADEPWWRQRRGQPATQEGE
jgi:23S rRNA-/tRNA-specific pseudouridylate synthase